MSCVRFLSSLVRVSLDQTFGGGVMSPQRFAVLAVLCATIVLSGWAAEFVGSGSRSENDGARIAVDTPQPTAIAEDRVDGASILGMIDAAFSDLRQPPPMRIASAG